MSYALQRKAFCFFTSIVCLMRSWHHQFPCSVKNEICVCIVWELEDSVFNILNYLACQYAKTGNVLLWSVTLMSALLTSQACVVIMHFKNVFLIPQLSQLMLDQPHPATTDYNTRTIQWFPIF